jgi:hypothetical protein
VPRGIKGIVTLDRNFPPNSRIGGFLSAASVKILEGKKDQRNEWWNELREEVMRHAVGLGCNVVAGYREDMNIDEDGLAVLQVWLTT